MTVIDRPDTGQEAFGREQFRAEGAGLLEGLAECGNLGQARQRLLANLNAVFTYHWDPERSTPSHARIRSRDCGRALRTMLEPRSEQRSGFSLAKALWDVAAGWPRPDLGEGFFADLIHLVRGLECRSPFHLLQDARPYDGLSGREAALARSDELDALWQRVEAGMARYSDGLDETVVARRRRRRQQVLAALGGSESDWDDWRWQVAHAFRDERGLGQAVRLSADEAVAIRLAVEHGLPFAVTPYYAALMDDEGDADRAVRAQVIPPDDYVRALSESGRAACDFMREADTSPADRVTRRYPGIAILKPCLACPQVCVYCQRNWELAASAQEEGAGPDGIAAGLDYIRQHRSIREVLVTGGDPLLLDDQALFDVLDRLAEIDHVDLIRIGTRTPVVMPMRITEEVARRLGGLRRLGRRDLAVVTHVEHPYEITPELAEAVDRLRRQGLGVYNQQVYTFYVSRRFETAALRMLLRRVGIDPYYSFAPKAKPETRSYRVPIARILQERREEARLLPGLRRTDEPVYNVPGLGKNHLRAAQHRDLLCIRGDGARMYEFHAWEKNVVRRASHISADVPILDYLRRLAEIGEDPAEYQSIWYYF